MTTKCKKTSRGQAVIEYLFMLIFISLIGIKLIQGLSAFMFESIGGLGHVLNVHLSVGVCKESCFNNSYVNGWNEN